MFENYYFTTELYRVLFVDPTVIYRREIFVTTLATVGLNSVLLIISGL